MEPVGNYAIKIVFDDLHDSGIYTWDYLYQLGENSDRIWASYLSDLTNAGLSRDPTAVIASKTKTEGGCGCGSGGGKGGCGK